MSWLFLVFSVISFLFTVNALWPFRRPWPVAIFGFFAGWLTTELCLHLLFWQALFTCGWFWAGAFVEWQGMTGLSLTALSWAGLWVMLLQAQQSRGVFERALKEAFSQSDKPVDLSLAASPASGLSFRHLVLPFPISHPEVEKIPDLLYHRVDGINLRLDIYRHRTRHGPCPVILQVHGGAWILGSKNEQGIPLLTHLAASGWIGVNANYRLSPRATFPDHLIDLKRAIAWIRQHIHEYGGNPEFLAVTGGSAGGHLSSLLALTANDPVYQPGFEGVDTSVQACVPCYGVYDFADEVKHSQQKIWQRLIEHYVMKASFEEEREKFEKASPIRRVHAEAPPFFVIHGTNDTLVPVREARNFVAVLRACSGAEVAYAELPGTQHAFDVFPSLRTLYAVRAIERFLAAIYARHHLPPR